MTQHRIAIFADVQNIYYTTRQAYQHQFNYRALWQKIHDQGHISHAFAYAIDRGDASQMKFQSALHHIGFKVKLKNYIKRADGSSKGDWDVGIAIDVIETAAEVDEVILLSGDGDFAILLDHVKQKYGVRTTVYGVPALTADALIDACDHFCAIEEGLLL